MTGDPFTLVIVSAPTVPDFMASWSRRAAVVSCSELSGSVAESRVNVRSV
jgi:hypothetical protein